MMITRSALPLMALALLVATCANPAAEAPTGSQVVAELADSKITVNVQSVKAGTIKIGVRNLGTMEHSFVVLKTDLLQDKLPVDGASAKAKEDGKVGEIPSIPAGKSAAVTKISTMSTISNPDVISSRMRSPCPNWNSVSFVSGQSMRFMPSCGRCNFSWTFPVSGAHRIESVELRRKTSSPFGRRSRAASGIHLYGSHQIEAPYSEIARSKEAPGRPVASAFASTSSRPSPYFEFIRRAVSSWAGVISMPTTRRAPRRFNHAETYAVPHPSSTMSLPRTSGRTLTSDSGVLHTPHEISCSFHACSARPSV